MAEAGFETKYGVLPVEESEKPKTPHVQSHYNNHDYGPPNAWGIPSLPLVPL